MLQSVAVMFGGATGLIDLIGELAPKTDGSLPAAAIMLVDAFQVESPHVIGLRDSRPAGRRRGAVEAGLVNPVATCVVTCRYPRPQTGLRHCLDDRPGATPLRVGSLGGSVGLDE